MAISVLVTDPNAIDFGHEGLRDRAAAWLGQPLDVYRPLPFVEHSGFSETVREEIAMVLANHAPNEAPLRDFSAFVGAWGLADLLDRRVLDLSGGWRKYLGLALFMNRPLPARLLLDTTSHLSDARMRTLLLRADEYGETIFCEYDHQLLLKLGHQDGFIAPTLHVLTDDGVSVSEGLN